MAAASEVGTIHAQLRSSLSVVSDTATCGHDAERATGAHQQLRHRRTHVVLAQRRELIEHGAVVVGQHRPHAQHRGAHVAVTQHAGAAGVGRDHPAQARVRPQVDRQRQAVGLGCTVQLGQAARRRRRPRCDPPGRSSEARRRRVSDSTTASLCAGGVDAPTSPVLAPWGINRTPVAAGPPDHRPHLVGVGGSSDGGGITGRPAPRGHVAHDVARVAQDSVRPELGPELVDRVAGRHRNIIVADFLRCDP